MTEQQADALAIFLTSTITAGRSGGFECGKELDTDEWFVQFNPHGSYAYIETFPTAALDELVKATFEPSYA